MAINPIIVAIQREFHAPKIDPEWVEACAEALQAAGQVADFQSIREQYLYSDLAQSTILSELIPPEAHNIHLFPSPTLVQIVSITEIGSSSFQLQTVLEQRKDVLSGATRIRRMDDEEEDEDAEIGKLPAYPRGMLKLEITDGTRVMKCMEYKRLDGLKLGETRLGSKLLLQRVKALRGTLLLEPANTKIVGYEVEALEAEQVTKFLASLKERLNAGNTSAGGTESGATNGLPRQSIDPPAPRQRLTLPPTSSRSTTRSRVTPAPSVPPSNGVESPYFRQPNATASSSRPARSARTSATARITTLYDQTAQSAQPSTAGPSRTRQPHAQITEIEDEDDWDDSFMRHADQAVAQASHRRVKADGSSDYGIEEIPDDVFNEMDEIEVRYSGQGRSMSGFPRSEMEEEDEDDWMIQVDPDRLARISSRGAKRGGSSTRKRRYGVDDKENDPDIIEVSD